MVRDWRLYVNSRKKLFGTNGIRGIPGKDITLEFVSKIGLSLATFFKSGNILVGYDGRDSGPSLSRAIAAGLMEGGIDVTDAGMLPTPALQLAIPTLGFTGGVMITASHNPPEYNGIKALASAGIEVTREDENLIEGIYYDQKYQRAKWDAVGHLSKEERAIRLYIDSVVDQVDSRSLKERKATIVIDVGNGVQALAAPYIAERLGCKVITLNGHVDGKFPGRGAEPTPETLSDLSAAVRTYGADLGVGYDGDGDRSVFCDEKGEIFWGDKSGALICGHVLSTKKIAPIVTTIATSLIVDEVAKKFGSKVIRTRVGSVDVTYRMRLENSVFGMEENGGCFYAPLLEVRDGAMATALMLELLAISKRPLSSLLSDLPVFFQSKTKFSCPVDRRPKVLELFSSSVDARTDTLDGVKVWEDNQSWVLLRPSGTEPILRLFGESNSKHHLEAMMSRYVEKVEQILSSSS